ncbi:hypothetical protein F5X98DRAFT_385062 [Xylaria grammica]|nr:hypothetical protein F5X98DRAFT_385062 [Xylaria grammica]
MASQSDTALTCKLPSQKNAPFLRFNCPDWSKIDIVGQTILIAELTSHFGSFQNTCTALKLQSNEVDSFLLTYLQYKKACDQGSLAAEKWGREQAVPADDEDIPQQRPLLISPSSIMPACNFLNAMGYHDLVPQVREWSQKSIIWPPDFDVTSLSRLGLDQSDIVFLPHREQERHRVRTSLPHNDAQAMIAFVNAWKQKEDGTPDAHIAFIDLPDGSVIYGPGGCRQLTDAGRYSLCLPIDDIPNDQYHELVLARNPFDTQGLSNNHFNPPGPRDYQNANASDELTQMDTQLEGLSMGEEPSMTYTTLSGELLANPEDIFGTDMTGAHSIENEKKAPFHPQTEPQDPSRKLENLQLSQMWNSWPGQLFQFRLPHGYTIMGPQGHVLTFDPPQHERYDDLGDPHGIGGTYCIAPPAQMERSSCFKVHELPANVFLRFKTLERLAIIRDGMVLPGFVEPGVLEWSTRDGFLDLYGAHGCYEVHPREDSDFPMGEHQQSYEDVEHGRNIATHPAPIREALEIIEPYRDWLDHEEDETVRLEEQAAERARLDARMARQRAHQDILMEERESRKRALEARKAQEQATLDAVVRGDTAATRSIHNNGASMHQGFENPTDPNSSDMPPPNRQTGYTQYQQQEEPVGQSIAAMPDSASQVKATPKRGGAAGVVRRRRTRDEEDEDYTPSWGKKPKSTRNAPTTRKSQGKRATTARGTGVFRLDSAPKGRPARAMPSQAQVKKGELGPAPGKMLPPPRPSATKAQPPRATGHRKPIGPLLDAMQADSANGRRRLMAVPKVGDRRTAASNADGNAAGGSNKMSLRARTSKPSYALDDSFADDPEETESDGEY